MLNGGLVDYVVGARPGGGVFVIGYNEDPLQQQYLNYYKMGDGPFYVFYTPYHLCHLDTPLSAARAVLFGDATLAPMAGPVCDVLTAAKRDLQAGETLDGFGGFLSYGLLENSDVCLAQNLLPMGLAEGCCLRHDIRQDSVLTYDDVIVPPNRLSDHLRAEQLAYFEPSRSL